MIATQIERADYAWRNTNVIEKAYQEERAKRDELLAALESILAADASENDHEYYRALDLARAAIAKAKP